VIPQSGLVLLYGESSSGKTTLAVDVGMHIATGRDFLGRRCSAGAVIHVAGEGVPGLAARVRAYRKVHRIGDVPYVVVHRTIDLALAKDVEWVIDTIAQVARERGKQVALVIIDTLARCAGIDENLSADMGRVIRACDRVRATGAAVMLVHHTGKDPTKGARGSYALHAGIDTEIEVSGTSGLRNVEVTKQRDAPAGDSWQFELRQVELDRDPETGRAITACYVEHRESAPDYTGVRRGRAAIQSRAQPLQLRKVQRRVVQIVREHADRGVLRVPKAVIIRDAHEKHGQSRPPYDTINQLVSAGVLIEDERGIGLVDRTHAPLEVKEVGQEVRSQ
jgi:hypothetical protein